MYLSYLLPELRGMTKASSQCAVLFDSIIIILANKRKIRTPIANPHTSEKCGNLIFECRIDHR